MKFLLSFLLACLVSSLSCSAAEVDSNEYYSYDPLTMSALDYAVMPLSATSWDTSDQAHLAAIRNSLTTTSTIGSGTVLGWLARIGSSYVPSAFTDSSASDLSLIRGYVQTSDNTLGSILTHLRNNLPYLSNLTSLQSIDSSLDSIDLNSAGLLNVFTNYYNYFTQARAVSFYDIVPDGSLGELKSRNGSWGYLLTYAAYNLFYDGYFMDFSGSSGPTLYNMVKRLADVQASYDDVALADSQKSNREEIEDSFLTGSSGSTSLGASDFANLADVGGTVKDSLSLDGNATISSFTSGLSAADSAGQGWFSEETRSQLDSVSSTVTYSLRDPDPYNMEGWENRYYWLLGDGD